MTSRMGTATGVALAFTIAAGSSSALAEYGVSGKLEWSFQSYDHVTLVREDVGARPSNRLVGTAAYSDEYGSVGTWGGSGATRYFANLAQAAVGSYADVIALDNKWYEVNGVQLWQTDRGTMQSFIEAWDRLTVNVPAGDYGAGVHATLTGFVRGDVDLIGDYLSQGRATWGATVTAGGVSLPYVFGDTNLLHASNGYYPLSGNTMVPVDIPFSFQIPLASGVVSTAKSITIDVGLSLQSLAAVQSTAGTGSAVSDMGATMAFTSFIVPQPMSWSSESGVFLSQPIPEPGTWTMLLAGGVLIGWRVGARRGRR